MLTSFGTWGLPQMIGKFYAIKDTAAIKRGTIISTIFCIIIGCGAYLIGSTSRLILSGQLCRECLSRIYIKNHSCSDQYDPDAMLSNDIGVVGQAESVSADIDFYAHSAAKM